MIARLASAIPLSFSAIALTAVTAYSHSGGLDGYGWHYDRKNGGYHCHQGSFAGQSFASKNEMLAALETQYPRAKRSAPPGAISSSIGDVI